MVREDRVFPTGPGEPLERRKRVVEERPPDARIDGEPPRGVGELERPRGHVSRALVRPREQRTHEGPPGLRLAQLRMRNIRRVAGKAVPQVGAECLGRVAVAGLLVIEGLGEQDAPARLPAPVGERPVEVPDHEPHVAHPISWKTTRVVSAPSAAPYVTSSTE